MSDSRSHRGNRRDDRSKQWSRERSPRRERRRDRSRSPNERRERISEDRIRKRDDYGGEFEKDNRERRREDIRRERDRPRRERDGHRKEEDHQRSGRDGAGRRDRNREKDDGGRRHEEKDSQKSNDGSPHKPWIQSKGASEESEAVKKAEPDFGVSGKLAAETNTLNGVLIKYSEPPEARIPKTRWRLYQFKGEDHQNTLYLHRQSAYLIGRDRKIVDFPIDHPSCSKQHAVLQYRLVDYEKQDGRKGKKVKPYVIDLESTNGTYVNGDRIDNRRFVELKEKDVIKFGFSSREYVLLHENSKGSGDEDEEPDPSTEGASKATK